MPRRIRFVYITDKKGMNEELHFTENFEYDANDFCKPGLDVYEDEEIIVPPSFPLGEFKRIY